MKNKVFLFKKWLQIGVSLSLFFYIISCTIIADTLPELTLNPDGTIYLLNGQQTNISINNLSYYKDSLAEISWTIADTNVATITNTNTDKVTVTAKNPGITTITASISNTNTISSILTAIATIKVRPPVPKLNVVCKSFPPKLTWNTSNSSITTSYRLYRDNQLIVRGTNQGTNTVYFDTDGTLQTGASYNYKVESCIDDDACSGAFDGQSVTISNKNAFRYISVSGKMPASLDSYDQKYWDIFSRYNDPDTLVAKYLKTNGTGDGSSFNNAARNLGDVLDGITDASTNKVYAIFLTGGNYRARSQMKMKNYVAIIGGVEDECLEPSDTATELDGDGSYRVFNHPSSSPRLGSVALLYRVTITNGKANKGGGMFNQSSSPSLSHVTFSGNTANRGGGMHNFDSSPTLVGVTFSGNTANNVGNVGNVGNGGNGGGMYNDFISSPSLSDVTFSGNKANYGGGMYNNGNSRPSLSDVTFSVNEAVNNGGGIFNQRSSPSLVGGTFSGNKANNGGGMYNYDNSSPTLVGVTFSGNTANNVGNVGNVGNGGGIFNQSSSPSLSDVTFSVNEANYGGGMYNNGNSRPSLSDVTFSVNKAVNNGGGIFNQSSSPSLSDVTFSVNEANNGGGMYNYDNSSPTLVGVTFLGNGAKSGGGGMYNNNNNGEAGPLIINGIFWGNTASVGGKQFYFLNDNTDQENLRIYNSIVEGGTGNLVSGDTYTSVNQGGLVSGEGSAPVVISFANITNTNPQLGELADNGGSVWTHAIQSDSPAVNQGLYVKRDQTTNTFYYSKDDTDWYAKPDLSGTAVTVPAGAEYLTATDATGHTRTEEPDLGAYEAR